jgi:DNA-binding transcriptional MerR regulator
MPSITETITRRYYQIGEVAHLLGRSVSAIRFYSDQFAINPIRKGNGARMFTPQQFEKLSHINALMQQKKAVSMELGIRAIKNKI